MTFNNSEIPDFYNREMLEKLWKEESTRMLNLAYRILKDRDKAEDVLMDVFSSIPETIKSFRNESTISTWLFKMTLNASLMQIRKEKRHFELETENSDFILEKTIGFKKELSHFESNALTEALNALPALNRSILWLKDAEGVSVNELATIYKSPSGTIKARLSRARTFVRDFIERRNKND